MSEISAVSTGSVVLDEILQGGLPPLRTVLLTGSPGTGKSTLAMQFLQAGLDAGERCLFISTEQTRDELRDGFSPFEFDIDHDRLTITTIHATPGQTIERDEALTLHTLDAGERIIGEEVGIPFTSDRIQEHLQRIGDCDRVVLDSVSGLEPMAPDRDAFRRGVLDLIRLFNDDMSATAIFTAELIGKPHEASVESVGVHDAIQYNTQGVIRLWREAVEGDYHRFLDVMKMRGVAHDTRRFEIEFDGSGVRIMPRNRAHSTGFIEHTHHPTGIQGLDELGGGGLLQGTGTLLEHDGQANLDALLSNVFASILGSDMSLTLVPTVEMKERRIAELLRNQPKSISELLDSNALFVLDMVGAWKTDHQNIFDVQDEDAGLEYLLQIIAERSANGRTGYVMNTEAIVHGIGAEDARRFRYWLEANFIGPEELHLDITNPNVMQPDLAAFYVDAAGQVLRTWVAPSGLQYIRLKKSPIGEIGSVRLVEYIETAPYVRIQQR